MCLKVCVVSRTKMFVASRRPLYRLPSVLTTVTREVGQAGVDVDVVAPAVARDVARKLAIDHLEARPL